jgi:hypothetical protein
VKSLLRKLTVPTVACVALASPAVAEKLTGQEFVDTHAGNCLTYTGPSSGTQCYRADGTTAYEDETYGSDTGTWTVQGDDVCETFTQEPALDCGPVSRTNDGGFTDGVYTWTID